ncbi:hypothetical protein FVO58_12305 [Metabacillus halosaccharovorans]|nr:hypothetical protein [Metabacillus halosaccharovorans]
MSLERGGNPNIQTENFTRFSQKTERMVVLELESLGTIGFLFCFLLIHMNDYVNLFTEILFSIGRFYLNIH